MCSGKSILGLIPARGGSKGLLGKNIKPLLGKPLIAWTIEQALASKYLDRVIVSTDSEEIAEISRKYGAKAPFIRPKELATDEARSEDVVFHAIEFFKDRGTNFDYVTLLEPTSPLRKNTDIDEGIEKLIDNEERAESLVSVGKIALEHPLISKKIDENGFIRPFFNRESNIRRQKLEEAHFPYGVLYISKVSSLYKYRSFYQERTLAFLIERWQNYEVDDIYDFLAIEAIMKLKKESEI